MSRCSRRRGQPSETFEQRRKRNFECVGKSGEMAHGWVPNTLFDAPHVGAVHTGFIGQELLRPSFCLSELPNPLAERLLDGL